VGIITGVVAFLWPAITALVLIYLIGAWALVTGILEIVAAVRLRKHIAGEWLLALSGIASVLFGVLVLVVPLAGAVAIALWVGIYSLVFGIILIGFGIRLRAWSKHPGIAGSIQATAH
jgi:uncharacterized membrane protein HdeD (DUF308 family)